ncbi:MAG: DNA cytosine methyltransferase [Atopobiaceae bacterium]|nr:DNA cytosine methyltransferase [Atopobiaceae bacterium]
MSDTLTKPLAAFSFFSGSGFLDLGFSRAGIEIVMVNEFYQPFMLAYQHSRKVLGEPEPRFGYRQCDVNEFLDGNALHDWLANKVSEARSTGSLVGFIGGPPCPDFSIAGKQAGRDGKNGQLSDVYRRIIVEQQPDWFVFENVKGLWSTAKHRAYYEELHESLAEAGYCLTDRLCNSLEFGAPQDRDRVILFGVKEDLCSDGLGDFDWNAHIVHDLDEVKASSWPTTDPFVVGSVRPAPKGIIEELTVEHAFIANDVEHHPNANRFLKPKSPRIAEVDEGDTSRKSYKRPHRWRFSPTVAYGNNEVHLHPYKARRLSVAEALSLQSLPKEFELPNDMTLTDSFKTIGNGVPYRLAYGVASTIRDWVVNHVESDSV